MPSCSTHSGNCTCGIVNIPIPKDIEDVITCEVCGNESSDCGCVECSSCKNMSCDPLCENCNLCSDCCGRTSECLMCKCCSRVIKLSDACTNCQECNRCCSCLFCGECDGVFCESDWCCECDHCVACCTCNTDDFMHCQIVQSRFVRGMDASEEIKGNWFWKARLNEHKINPSKRYCSAEIEVAILNKKEKSRLVEETCYDWGAAIVHDGSLPNTGFEINTAPASGDKYIEQIASICTALGKAGAKVTGDCGLHVHIDARDFSYWEIRKLIFLYAKIEDGLFSIVGTNRQNSTYCKRCGKDYLRAAQSGKPRKMKEAICKAVYKTNDIKGRRRGKYDDSRYTALNLHSWFYRGTVECRLFGETTSDNKIQNWGMLWCGILDWAYTHNEKDIKQFDNKTSIESLVAVAPTERVANWVKERYNKYGGTYSVESEDY